MRARMKKTLATFVVLFALFVAWSAWPFFGLYGLASAVRSGDPAAVEQRIDFPALRRSLADQVAIAYARVTGKRIDRGLIGIAAGGSTFGTGYEQARGAIEGTALPWYYFAAKLAAGLLSLAGTLSYAEVAALHPHAGGEYVYLRRAYGRFAGFMCGWTFFTVARRGAQAALAVGCGACFGW